MKTCTILIHHVFGTKGTVFVSVSYRNKQLWKNMENNTPQAMLEKAKQWAFSNGFTHVKIEY